MGTAQVLMYQGQSIIILIKLLSSYEIKELGIFHAKQLHTSPERGNKKELLFHCPCVSRQRDKKQTAALKTWEAWETKKAWAPSSLFLREMPFAYSESKSVGHMLLARTQGRVVPVSPWIHSLTYQFIYSESVDESNDSPPCYISIRQATESDTGQRGGHSHLENAPSDELSESAEEG